MIFNLASSLHLKSNSRMFPVTKFFEKYFYLGMIMAKFFHKHTLYKTKESKDKILYFFIMTFSRLN